MQFDRNHYIGSVLIFLMLLATANVVAQQPKSLTASANGKGTLKVGKEQFDVHAVVVKLLEDGKAEITLVSDITVFLNGNWTAGTDQNVINVEITGGATEGGLQGNGKIFLGQDGKSITSLVLQGSSKTTKRNVEVKFEAS